MQSFAEFMQIREEAAKAYTMGDASHVNDLTADIAPVTFFGPDGTVLKAPADVKQSFRGGAAQFGPGGQSRIEVLQQAEGGDVAYWSGIQHAEVELDGEIKPMSLRITELFRRDDGEWKLVHRHADALRQS